MAVADLVDIRAVELLPIIEELNEKGWVLDTVTGNMIEIKEAIQKPAHPSCLKPLPVSIYEYYTEAYKERSIPRPIVPEEVLGLEEEDLFANHRGEAYLRGFMVSEVEEEIGLNEAIYIENEDDEYEEYTGEETVRTVVRKGPKLGRNDLCHCGSGLKYKKCCMRKD